VVEPEQPIPTVGWRAAVYSATGGRVNLGISAAERDWLELLTRVRRPISGARQIAVASIKGGVGKTTVAACLGLMLAEYRGDGVVAVDADPDAGTLADRLTGEPTVTVRDLLANLDKIRSLSQLGEYTSMAGRLRVLAGEQDPAVGEAFRREDYQRVCRTLARFFDIVITDSGTGLVHSTMRGTLELADRLIVVGTPTVDGASRASKTLDWLLAHGHERLAEQAVLVLCQDRGSHRVDHRTLFAHFTERCQQVIEIPADPHLYSGGLINPALLRPATVRAYLQLAAVVADGFAT
jgi:MinD-like ATPase involved in chromosome partitioning or flagellar assembly